MRADDPGRKAKDAAHRLVGAEPGKTVLDGRRDVRVLHSRFVAHEREEGADVCWLERSELEAPGLDGRGSHRGVSYARPNVRAKLPAEAGTVSPA